MTPTPRTFSHIGISVPDLDAAVKFYAEVMGFYVIMQPSEVTEDDSAIGVMCTDVFGPGWDRLRIAHHVDPVDGDPSGRRSDQPADHLHRRGLARTVGTEKSMDLTRFDGQIAQDIEGIPRAAGHDDLRLTHVPSHGRRPIYA